jgi:hypothetical protein
MSLPLNDYDIAPDLVDAAREIIRSQDDLCIVGISQLLDELSDKFGDRFCVSPDTNQLLYLIMSLWADPHIDRIPDRWIEFAWNEAGSCDACSSHRI